MTKPAPAPTRYQARAGAICGRNQGRYFNRPLYVANTDAFVLAGDRPIVRLASGDTLHGTFLAAIVRAGKTHWLHELAEVESECRPAHFRWVGRDPALAGLTATLEVTALGDEVGCALRARVEGARRGDCLLWIYGGAATWPDKVLNWEFDPHTPTKLVPLPFDPALSRGNVVRAHADGFEVRSSGKPTWATVGRCSVAVGMAVGAADRLERIGLGSVSRRRPTALVAGGRVRLTQHADLAWSLTRVKIGEATRTMKPADPEERFAAGLARSAALAGRVVVETPDARLNAAAAQLGAAVDGTWYPPVFRHGGMLWNRRYPGWRTVFGGTVAGWSERVKAQAAFYFGHQVKADRKRSRRADPALLLTAPAKDSRFYGRGRIKADQAVYNMQTQFFDQVIHAWRWTGDQDLAAKLRPALELHLEWIRECFDPDGDGLYESVINVWPTDSVWFGGGGGAEETAYAYRAHAAARDLARGAGDGAAVRRHEAVMRRIARAFRARLWIAAQGHAGLYREQGGLERLHADAWLYSIFLPIDAGLVDTGQASESLHYSEWALQNEFMPAGGRRVWTSNFVPGIWSVRELWPGDNYHLALAYFQTGLARDGWEVFRGTFLQTLYNDTVPGDFGASTGGTDFGDCTSMFARALVEGLFGYAPDYPNNVVRLAPHFPEEWDHARLRTPDVVLRYQRRGSTLTLDIDLSRAAPLEISLAVCARGIARVTADGRPVAWQARPGFGCTAVVVRLPATGRTRIELMTTGRRRTFAPTAVAARAGRPIVLRAASAKIVAVEDPQQVFAQAAVRGGAIHATLRGTVGGHHTVLADVRFGELPQRRLFRLRVQETVPAAVPTLRRIPARATWACIDLQPILNGDIRTIFQQKYLSPRPETVSVRLGTDGYTSWTFVYWKCPLPEITLDAVPAMLEGADQSRLRTPQGVPFAWPGEGRNVAFTSRWDNWPTRVAAPVGRAGAAAWFLVCGSTNPMQGRIANAVLKLRYADGVVETLELVPPFNYWNLCPIRIGSTAPGQESRDDYTAKADAFCVPAVPPPTVQLGRNCRAMLVHRRLRPGVVLQSVTLEALSQEVVVGLMGLTIMSPAP